MPFIQCIDAALIGLRAESLVPPSMQNPSPQRSEDASSPDAALVTCPTDSAAQQQSEGECLLQCLYMAGRCDRRCAGCVVTAQAAAGARLRDGAAAAAARAFDAPPSNTGVNNEVEGVGHVR